METTELTIPGLLLIRPRVFEDDRGFFYESWREDRYKKIGMEAFVQDNHSRSRRGVLRGMHFRRKRPEAKLVYLSRGSMLQVVIDLRRGSPAFGKWCSVLHDAASPRQVYVPKGCANGYCVLSDWADVQYKMSEYYDPTDESGLVWNDPTIAIEWPNDIDFILSDKDRSHARLDDLNPADLPDAGFDTPPRPRGA